MTSDLNFLTSCHLDWDPHLSRIRQVLEEVETKVAAKTDPEFDSVFDCPNRAIMVGSVRYWEVNRHLKRACEIGWFGPITANWEELSDVPGGFHEMVLRSQHTTLTAVHLAKPDDAPRASTRRRNTRRINYQLSLFDDSVEIDDLSSVSHLTLVHGGKGEHRFAFLRLYYDPEYPGRFIPLSPDIMGLPFVVEAAEAEQVQEVKVTIKPHVIKKTDESAQ